MMHLKTGDVFCVHGNMGFVSAGIRCAERFWSKDNEATYGHAGIITDPMGNTLEALWTVKESNINKYKGTRLIIARPLYTNSYKKITESQKKLSITAVKSKHHGQFYPLHRLAFHLVPPLAKYAHLGSRVVCSELVAKYLYLIGARHAVYSGTNPDTLADEWRRWKQFEIIAEGILDESFDYRSNKMQAV
jgi:hypothetical protein